MTATELIDRFKRALLAIVVLVMVGPVLLYSVTPSLYYVADDGLITVYIKSHEEPVVIHCPDFHVGLEEISLRGHYASSYKTSIQGAFKYILLRGVSTLGPVTFNIDSVDGSETGTVIMQSQDHPIVPQAFVHIGRSHMEKKISVGEETYAVEVVWHGAVNAERPPLKAVQVDGKPMPRRFTAWGVI